MKTIALVLLVAACSSAAADTGSGAPRTPPRPPEPAATACKPGGDVLFQADHMVDPKKEPVWTTKLYTSGAWTTKPSDPKATAKLGCLDKDVMEKIRTDLKSSPWKISHARMHCMAFSASHVIYSWNGKQLIDSRLCSPDTLDDKSQKALDDIVKLLAPAAPPEPSAGDKVY
jgi:hypothetical protein